MNTVSPVLEFFSDYLTIVLCCFIVKHFLADFIFQTKFQYENKGNYGKLGGIVHSGIHAVLTFSIAFYFTYEIQTALTVAAIDFLIHYHIDYFKVKLNKKLNLVPTQDMFWWLLGFDQMLHMLTYVFLVNIMIGRV